MRPEVIEHWLLEEVGIEIVPGSGRSVSGGCIHSARLFERPDGGTIFVKSNQPDALAMFEAERDGLEALAASDSIRVPHPIAVGTTGDKAFFAMEGLEMRSRADAIAQDRMGKAIATLHRTRSAEGRFGFDTDNFIGATPQKNGWSDSWADFFTDQRLGFQFQLAEKKGRTYSDAQLGLKKIRTHLATLPIEPALLHGDLWGGNASFDETGSPVIFDPAVYYGDGETDIAFTRMFGGFGTAFYEAYRRIHPAPEPIRESIYNLYHLLNHFNLFGGGYGNQAERALGEIVRSL